MIVRKYAKVGIFNAEGLAKVADLLRMPFAQVMAGSKELIQDKILMDEAAAEFETSVLLNRFDAGKKFFHFFNQSKKIQLLSTDQGLWSWLALAYMPVLFENAPNSAKIGEQARWILDTQKSRYYRHLLAGPYYIYSHHYPQPERAMSLLCGPVMVPGEIVGQIAATSNIAFSVGAEVATKLYYDPQTAKIRKSAGGQGPGSARRLSAAYLNQIDLTIDYRGMTANQIISILPSEFNKFKA